MEIPILPEGVGVNYDTGPPPRADAPKDVAVGLIKGMWAIVVEGVIVGRTSTVESAQAMAARIKAGTVPLPEKFPPSWGRYARSDA